MTTDPFADLQGLGNTETPTDYWDHYEEASEGGGIPKGDYYFTIPSPGDDFQVQKSKKLNDDGSSNLSLVMSATVVDGNYKGRKVRFLRFPLKNRHRSGSLAGDLVLATKIGAKPRTGDDWKIAMQQMAGKVVKLRLDLQVYDTETKSTVFKNESQLPRGADGPRMRFVVASGGTIVPESEEARVEKEDGGHRILWANNQVVRVIAE